MVEAEYVEFTIPYLLKLKDSFGKNPEWRFEIEREGQVAELRFRKEKSDDFDYTAFPKGDRSGKLCWTKVQVRFPGGLSNEGQSEHGPLIEASRSAINRFLEVYRAIMGDEWIRDLAFQNIVEFTVYWDLGSEIKSDIVYVPNDTFGDFEIDTERRDKIQQYLDNGIGINPSKKMDLDTQEKIHRGEYDLAVINADRLFEFWAINTFVYLKENRGASTEDAIELVTENKFTNVISNYYRDHLGFDFQDTTEYEDWREETRKLRNKVIHEGWHITEKEAQKAYQASQKAIAAIMEEFKEELRGTNLFAEIDYPD